MYISYKLFFVIQFFNITGIRKGNTYFSFTFILLLLYHRQVGVEKYRAGNSLIGFLSESLVFCEKMSDLLIC